jgi:hypothetical protein
VTAASNDIKIEVRDSRVTIKTIRRDAFGVHERKQFTISKRKFLNALDQAEFTVSWRDVR